MTDLCLYFQVHQPYRLRRLRPLESKEGFDYWDHAKNKEILDRAATKCYLPTNALIADLVRRTDGAFRVSYSLSGVFMDQLEAHRPDVLDSFRELARTGHVEFLDETHYHSLAGLWGDQAEVRAQVAEHRAAIQRHFGQTPTTFRNTELIYDDRIAQTVAGLGYKAILTEGADRILGGRSPNHLYRPAGGGDLRILLKNYKLSDDVAFRFSSHSWVQFPLTADKYANWLAATPGQTVNLFMDYETFGEHQWPETGIFQFLEHLPRETSRHQHLQYALPREVAARHEPVDSLHVPHAISWADTERDVSAWLHNKMQHHCFEQLRDVGNLVQQVRDTGLTTAWRRLQTSDHLYYCSTKSLDDQDIHSYFSPYTSPYLAFINYKNALDDLQAKAERMLRQ
ncbi:MAG TPA: glycoside hydrolase family 57 protein [Candidatus Thermoplasmatota archaeon]|nr:glycoside hydrolase family 57 protein [Candidatus Thermoplasmatota archaeon]